MRTSTARTLQAQLVALGVLPGQDLLVHCSMRRVGPVDGGPAALLAALRTVIGPSATLVLPAQTAGNSLSSKTFLAATEGLSQAQLAQFVAGMPGFDPATTPSSGMGAFAEYLRTRPGANRSAHPQTSFAALGSRAAECTARHDIDCHLGERSPLGWLRRSGAAALMLGVGYAKCTAFHLAEYRLGGTPARCEYRCYTSEQGTRKEHVFTDLDLDDGDFAELGARADGEPFVRRGLVGAADCRLLPIRAAVDFAVSWPPFRQRRRPGSC